MWLTSLTHSVPKKFTNIGIPQIIMNPQSEYYKFIMTSYKCLVTKQQKCVIWVHTYLITAASYLKLWLLIVLTRFSIHELMIYSKNCLLNLHSYWFFIWVKNWGAMIYKLIDCGKISFIQGWFIMQNKAQNLTT